jgi:adenylosuccinate lyase
MIPRYNVEDIAHLWSDTTKWALFLEVELAIIQAREGTNSSDIPLGTAFAIKQQVHLNLSRIEEIEQVVKHDVIAFCSSITEQLPPSLARYFHYGVTSSDIIDTSLMLQIKKSMSVIQKDLKTLLGVLKTLSWRMKDWPCMGRSHGMYAEPMSFGQKWLSFYAEFYRRYQDYEQVKKECRGQYSGSVGNYTFLNLSEEKKALDLLGLDAEPLSTQVIPRDRIAKILLSGSLLAAAIERLSVEIRHLHRSEVFELYEGFEKGQKGSSIMPHKKNPIAAENLCGIARVIKSHGTIALENCILWHERDISHSSAERLMLPDHFGLLSYGLRRLCKTLNNCVFQQDTIIKRAMDQKECLSAYFLHVILKQVPETTREEVYAWIQDLAFSSTLKTRKELVTTIRQTCEKKYGVERFKNVHFPMTDEEIATCYLKESDTLFSRVMQEYPEL